jgi:hypothetical protein
MNASHDNQRFNPEGNPSSLALPGHQRAMARRRLSNRFGFTATQKFLLLSTLCAVGALLQGPSVQGEENAAQTKTVPAGKKAAATFAQPPDPSTLPAPLPLPPEPSAPSPLDLLPAFPPSSPSEPSPDFLDLVLKKRQNPSLVPDGPNPTEAAALALDKRHRFQTARVQAMNDPVILEALSMAQKAHTDRELRAAMRRHYTLMFQKMRKLDPSLEGLIQEREAAALEPLEEKVTRAKSAVLKK